MVTLYGIPNCNTVKKARVWLTEQQIDYQFHNFKTDQLDTITLQNWIETLGWETLLNKRSATWRKLADQDKQNLNQERAAAIMLNNLSIIKRPVLHYSGQLSVGFTPEQYTQQFLK